MSNFSFPILSILVFTPLAGAGCLVLVSAARAFWGEEERYQRVLRRSALGVSVLVFLISVAVLVGFETDNPGYQMVEKAPWAPAIGLSYYLGVDGLSLFLVLLTTFLTVLVVASSCGIRSRLCGYLVSMLVLETGILGALLAVDLFLFYVFWELMLAPMYFIIGLWGGPRRVYAAVKFVLYTVAGSVLMLVAIAYLGWMHVVQGRGGGADLSFVFVLPDILTYTHFTLKQEMWLFCAFGLAFAIKVPIFPLHTWLPDAHVEAPTGGSVILAGVLLKMGLYGFLRVAYPLCPSAAAVCSPYLAALGVAGILYGALVAWAQADMKKLVAYSSVSHLGFCVVGLAACTALSTVGCVYQMLSHGLSTGGLFLVVGLLYDRRRTRHIDEFGGLASRMPRLAFLFFLIMLGSIALPLTSGFVGEFMILTGSFGTFQWLTAAAALGVILGAVYMLTLYLKTMFGPFDSGKNGMLQDLVPRETLVLGLLAVLIVYLGIYPQPLLRRMQPSLESMLALARSRVQLVVQDEGNVLIEPAGRQGILDDVK